MAKNELVTPLGDSAMDETNNALKITLATNGVNTMKTSWGSVDGLHPGQSAGQGSDIIAQRLVDLLMLVGD